MPTGANAYADLMERETGQAPEVSPSLFDSPYSQQIAQRMEDVNSYQPWSNPYAGDIANIWQEIRDRGQYQSQYADLLGQLMGDAVSRGTYQDPYREQYEQALGRADSYIGGYGDPYGDRIGRALEGIENYGPYQDPYADRIAGALDRVEGYGAYQSPYRQTIEDMLADLRTREFSYDMEADPLYQAARKTYLREADRTASDVLAKASANTGGRASSYAVSAASQAANYFKSQLTDRQQQLFDDAYARYKSEYTQAMNLATAYGALEDQAYGQWAGDYERARETLGDLRGLRSDDAALWQAEQNRRQKLYEDLLMMGQMDYGRWQDEAAMSQQAVNDLYNARSLDAALADAEYKRIASNLGLVSNLEQTDYARYLNDIELARADIGTARGLAEQEESTYWKNYALLLDQLGALNSQYDSDFGNWWTERGDMYSRLVNAISSTGYNPTDEELALAGMSREEADKWIAYYNNIGYYSGGRSYSGRGRTSNTGSTGETQSVTPNSAYVYSPTQRDTPIANTPSNIITNSIPILNDTGVYYATTDTPNPVTVSSTGLIQSTLNGGAGRNTYTDFLAEKEREERKDQVQQQRADRI